MSATEAASRLVTTDVNAIDLPALSLDQNDVVAGTPRTYYAPLATMEGAEVGTWEITSGVVTDVEVEEVFVVLSGSGLLTFADGTGLMLLPGTVVHLRAGDRTTWAIDHAMRKGLLHGFPRRRGTVRRQRGRDRMSQNPDHDRLQKLAKDRPVLHFSKQEVDDLMVLERGEGPYVYDTTGAQYIDPLSSLFCSQLGYSYGQEMAEVAQRQLTTLAFNTSWRTAHPATIELAEVVTSLAPSDDYRAFFTGGGSESVESAWKLAREYYMAIGQPRRIKAIARHTAYHGVTLGALSFTGVQPFKEGFGDAPIDVTRVSNTNRFRAVDGHDEQAFCRRLLQEVEDAIVAAGPDEVALIIAEPVQNAGGCFIPPEGYWQGLRRLADTYGALLMADEVITGFGRIGEWFASSRDGVAPDLISAAKGLTSAYAPMGAMLARDHVVAPLAERGTVFRHGITFGGHPLSAAVAHKSIEIIERDRVLENVRAQADPLGERVRSLLDLPIVGDVRGAGFFWAMELVKDDANTRFDKPDRDELLRSYLPRRLRRAGLIARCDDRGDAVLQIAPPLISDAALLDDIVDRLYEVLTDAGRHMATHTS